ncbi:MAG: energy-coupling factor transporter ATPase [Bacilli bacterium]|nr:energy-coupling factor transporter ATPase [Bacilli bacterium]
MSIKLTDVSYTYSPSTPFSYEALKKVNLEIKGHVFLALIGETGSGKSTLVQHLNGLLLPTAGTVQVDHYLLKTEGKKRIYIDLNKESDKKAFKKRKQFDLKELRKYAGLVFQFPEYQLFEETVIKDVAFGPKNFGADDKKAEEMAAAALKLVGLDSSYFERSPFELSGGEKRRAAIAGIIALEPKVLILDEPTAGLDPQGEKEMMALFQRIYEAGTSIIIVTHNMDLVLKYVQTAAVMSHGELLKIATPLSLFQDEDFLKNTAIEPPYVFKVALELKKKGLNLDLNEVKDIPSLVSQIKKAGESK